MVTIALIVMVGSLLGVAGTRMFQDKQFEISLKKLSEELALTESLALTYQVDITVVLKKRRGELILFREIDNAPPKIDFLFKETVALPGLEIPDSPTILRFYSNHHKEAPETLTFRAKHAKKTATMELSFFHLLK